MSDESIYQEIILDHFKHPHHRGLREPYEVEVRHLNPTCGDEITLRVHLDGDTVADVSYDGEGCSISQASASVMTDLVIGRTIEEALSVHEVEVRHLNPTCGDEITLRVHLDGDTVADVSYDGEGCSISQASASVMTDLVIGRTIEEALSVHEAFVALMHSRGELEPDEDVLEDAIAFRGVSRLTNRVKCALLAWMAWKDATAQANQATESIAGVAGGEGAA